MDAISKIQNVGNSTSQTAWLLQQINCKEIPKQEGKTYGLKETKERQELNATCGPYLDHKWGNVKCSKTKTGEI